MRFDPRNFVAAVMVVGASGLAVAHFFAGSRSLGVVVPALVLLCLVGFGIIAICNRIITGTFLPGLPAYRERSRNSTRHETLRWKFAYAILLLALVYTAAKLFGFVQ
jgi:hypothetical protein